MLTGKTRFRVSFWGKLILQVEYVHISYDAYGGLERENIVWRDATIEDITSYDVLANHSYIQER